MTAGVYKITNTKNGKFYIGSSENVERRWKQHTKDLMKGYHHCNKFQEDFVNYDLEDYTYEIIEEYPNFNYYNFNNKSKLRNMEQYYLDMYKDSGLLLNSSTNANGTNYDISEEEKKYYFEKRTEWRKQLNEKYNNKCIYKKEKEIFVYNSENELINHFDYIEECCKWLLDNDLVKTKSKTPIISISGSIRYAMKQNKPYKGFIFSYEPLEKEKQAS